MSETKTWHFPDSILFLHLFVETPVYIFSGISLPSLSAGRVF